MLRDTDISADPMHENHGYEASDEAPVSYRQARAATALSSSAVGPHGGSSVERLTPEEKIMADHETNPIEIWGRHRNLDVGRWVKGQGCLGRKGRGMALSLADM